MSTDRQVVIIQQDSNGLGLAGLIFSCIGWVTCGLLCIPGALLSFLGMFSKGPKGTAIAGLIVGFPGVIFFVLVGGTMLAGMIGFGAVATTAVATSGTTAARTTPVVQPAAVEESPIATEAMLEELPPTTESAIALTETPALEEPPAVQPELMAEETLPVVDFQPAEPVADADAGQPLFDEPLPEAEPTPELREFSDATGKFRVMAQFLSMNNGKVKLKKADGTEVEVPLEKLSSEDQLWIKNR
jgi:hypothetical protein